MISKLEFLKQNFAEKGYAEKGCLLSMVTIHLATAETNASFKKFPFGVFVEDGKFKYLNAGEVVEIEGDVKKPLFYMDDRLTLPGDFHPMLQGNPVETTFGLFLFNVVLFWDVFGDRVPYQNKEFTKKLVTGLIADMMVDDPAEGETLPPGKASVTECLRLSQHANYLQGIGSYVIKAGSVQALTINPAILKRRDELFKENKDKLHDPVVMNAIIDEVVQLDMADQMNGDSRTFYIDKKFIDNARKRMFVAFGVEFNSETNSYVSLTNSLDEGWDPDHMADYINTSIDGSYSRGKATGEGGAGVKETLRLVGRTTIGENDCGSPVGEVIQFTDKNKNYWVGTYYIKDKKAVLITKEVAQSLVGKAVPLRAPQHCTTENGNYCSVCLGEGLGKYGNRISADVVNVPTSFMLQRMKQAHTAGMSNTKLNMQTAIR